ncbi:hypothetical protein SADUNF_Sadunf08G0091400 [Salix dunnii]|uniref:Uncharacterized protein n=1 Tax=Salix dunnii TaxID=1413687 RepID=A0A835JW25_9ROSI|nr:hypothetical protein SADUNF_Sadunf08G0091400 [Salix dunnii]
MPFASNAIGWATLMGTCGLPCGICLLHHGASLGSHADQNKLPFRNEIEKKREYFPFWNYEEYKYTEGESEEHMDDEDTDFIHIAVIAEYGATLSTIGGGCTQPHALGSAGPAATIPLKMYPSLILKSASDCSSVYAIHVPCRERSVQFEQRICTCTGSVHEAGYVTSLHPKPRGEIPSACAKKLGQTFPRCLQPIPILQESTIMQITDPDKMESEKQILIGTSSQPSFKNVGIKSFKTPLPTKSSTEKEAIFLCSKRECDLLMLKGASMIKLVT